MKVGDRIGVKYLESGLLHTGRVTEIGETGALYCKTDEGITFIGVPGYDEIKPVYKWNKIKGAQQ